MALRHETQYRKRLKYSTDSRDSIPVRKAQPLAACLLPGGPAFDIRHPQFGVTLGWRRGLKIGGARLCLCSGPRPSVPILVEGALRRVERRFSDEDRRSCLTGERCRLGRRPVPGPTPGLVEITQVDLDPVTLCVEHLLPEIGAAPAEATLGPPAPLPSASVALPVEGLRLEEVERGLVRQALEAIDGHQIRAARLRGNGRDALGNGMKKCGFLPP